VNASVGRYYKIAPYTVLGFRDNSGKLVNKDAPYIQSDHLTAGVEYLPFKATRITVEGFYKWYDNYPVSNRDSISLANLGGDFGVIGNEDISSIGRGRTYGVEICLQQKFVKNFYGILAYTYYHSQFTGFRPQSFYPVRLG
jgi:outer membrane receptor protein involved in Fe transport